MNTKERSSNFELLRIVCMLMIVMFHAAFKGKFGESGGLADSLIIKSFWFLGELGVNVFVMISGYFMINSRFKPKKFALILCEVWFYNLVSVFILLFFKKYTVSELAVKLFPLTDNVYWFITCYLIIYALSPFLNRFIKRAGQKKLFELICVLLIINSVIPTVMGFLFKSSESFDFYNRLIWLLIIYIFGAYIRLYGFNLLNSLKGSAMLFVISYAVMLVSMVLLVFADRFLGLGIEPAYFWTPNSILMFTASVGLFGIGKNIRIPNNKVINRVASTTLGIYLIHDGFLTEITWPTVRNLQFIKDAQFSFIYLIAVSLIIFIVCIAVDLLRQQIEKYTAAKIINSEAVLKIYLKMREKFIRFESKMINDNGDEAVS